MLANIINLNCLFILLITTIVKAKDSYPRTDLNCYYIKDYHPNWSGGEGYEILCRNCCKTTVKEESALKKEMASNGFYRPRSALARALYEKQRNDRHLQELDKSEVRLIYINIKRPIAKNLDR